MEKCFDCEKPAKFRARRCDESILYLCKEHMEVYRANNKRLKPGYNPKIVRLISVKDFLKSVIR
jgi:hypothetical protein